MADKYFQPEEWSELIPLREMPGFGPTAAFSIIGKMREGLPFVCFELLEDRLGLSAQELAEAVRVPARTLARRRKEGRFNLDESERLERLTRLVSQAVQVLGTEERGRRWFRAPAVAFEGKTPLGMADTEIGAREVERLLGRLEHGVFA